MLENSATQDLKHFWITPRFWGYCYP